jgi:hypothetical protein
MADHGPEPTKPTRRTLLRATALLLLVPMFERTAGPAAAQDLSPPDFSSVTSKAAARKLLRQGRLVEISLFPVELGGPEDEPMNQSYITPEAAIARDLAIGTLVRFFEDGVIDELQVIPEYEGTSVVPRSIAMNATHSEQAGHFNTVIDVW